MGQNQDAEENNRGEHSEAKRKNTFGAILLLAVGGVAGVVLGNLLPAMIDAEWIPFAGLLVTLVGTVGAIGVSNDYPPAWGRHRVDKNPKKPREDKPPAKYSLRARHYWAAFSFLGLGFSAVLSIPATIDPLTCYLKSESGIPLGATLQCGGNVAAEIDLSKARPEIRTRIGFGNGDWTVTSASVDAVENGSTVLQVNTSSKELWCRYSWNTADPVGTTTMKCSAAGTPSF